MTLSFVPQKDIKAGDTVTVNIDLTKKKLLHRVIFNDPATIILWCDGSKTVVKARGKDVFDPEKGLAMAICKKIFGNSGAYYKLFKEYLPENNISEDEKEEIL